MSESRKKKIGIFVCHCGVNIAGVVDVEKVAKEMASYPDVELSTNYVYMCSEPGQATILEMAKENNLNAIIVAACSPTLHEMTFRNAAQLVGINAYQVEIANIREQCSLIHRDKEQATRKALDIIKTTVEKLRLDQALIPIKCSVNKKVLVIGGGISGIQAALDVANHGYRVVMVEREANIGGHVAELSQVFLSLDRGPDLLSTKVMEVHRHPKIELFTHAEVTSLSGYVGNFSATLKKRPTYVRVDRCDGCGLCVEKCPVAIPPELQHPSRKKDAIYLTTSQEIPQRAVIDKGVCRHFGGTCTECEKVCPRDAISFRQKEVSLDRQIGAVIVSTGFDLYAKEEIGEYSGGKSLDIIDGLQFEHLLTESSNNGGLLRRPSDGKVPKSVVFIQCTRSWDPENGMPYCSNICCKYTVKHASLYRKAVPDGQAFVFYIDVRTGGKDCDEVFQDAI